VLFWGAVFITIFKPDSLDAVFYSRKNIQSLLENYMILAR